MTSKRRRSGGEAVFAEQESTAQGVVAKTEDAGNLDTVTPATMKPGLEAALERFAQELRRELQQAEESIKALRDEVATLNARYEAHTHSVHPVSGASGAMWYDLSMIRQYLKDKTTTHDEYGMYLGRPKSSDQGTPPVTGPPKS